MTHEERTTMEIEMDDLERVEWELAEDENDDEEVRRRKRRVATGDLYEAARAGDAERVRELLHEGNQDVNARDRWDSTALYYSCLAGHADVARLLLENGAICAEHTFDGDRCHYAALNLRIRRLLKSFEARPPPLPPLPAALRNVFLSCPSNHPDFGRSGSTGVDTDYFAPDITFYITGRPIEAHRAILIARSPYFKMKFETDWKYRREVRFSNRKLLYVALYSLIHFFYCDRLDIAVDDMEDLVRVCKICRCDGLKNALEKEIMHQKYAEYKSVKNDDDSQKRFILQGTSLQEEERLPFAMKRLLELSLDRSSGWGNNVNSSGKIYHSYCYDDPCFDKEKNLKEYQQDADNKETLNESDIFSDIRHLFTEKNEANFDMAEGRNDGMELYSSHYDNKKDFDDHADICFLVEGKIFRSHQVILASRSEYFKARLSRASDFREGKAGRHNGSLLLLEEHDLSAEAFEKLLEYMYTDSVNHVDLFQAEEMFDVASRYLVFPLKRAVADALLPQLQNVTPAELCQWLMLADLYGVWKIKEYCLDLMAFNFEQFASLSEFHKMILSLPPPSGDSSQRTTAPSAPGEEEKSNDSNILDDLREKWLEAEAAELDQRDESARQFDKMLEILIQQAKYESQQNEI